MMSDCDSDFRRVRFSARIGSVGEDKEDTEGAFLQYVADTNGVISVEGTNKMVEVKFTCKPTNLPASEVVTVAHTGAGELYEVLASGKLVMVGTNDYPVCEIANRRFKLHGHAASSSCKDGEIRIEHPASGAKDLAKYTDVKLRVTNIKFNHDTSASAEDAINIRRSYADPIDVSSGEWIDTGTSVMNEPFCYTTNHSVTIKARIEASGFITSAVVRAACSGAKGSLSDVLETNVVFVGGVSSPEYVTFALKDKTLSKIDCSRGGILKWSATMINGGTSSCEMNETGPHTVYTIFSEPKPPWNNAYGNQQNAWTNALEFLIQDCAADSLSTSLDVLENATIVLYQIPYESRSQCWRGGGAAFSYSQYMRKSFTNCLDSSYGMCVTMRLAGIELISVMRTNFLEYNFHCYTKFPFRGDFLVFDCCSAVAPLQNGVSYSDYLRAGNSSGSVETELVFPIK